jgi:septal ring-binding cell division protein DamX
MVSAEPAAPISPAQPIVGIIEPAAEALAEQAWVNAMPAGSFVVQHAAMPTYQAATVWKKGIPALANARIVAVYKPREKLAYFVVMSGPFTSRALATASNDVRGKPAGAWVRTAASLRDQFNSEPVTAGQLQESPR